MGTVTELKPSLRAFCSPALQNLSGRLSCLGRRGFLTTVATTLATAGRPAAVLSQPPGQTDTVACRQPRLFDGRSSSLRENVQVIVEGTKIAATDAASNPPPAGARGIDCGRRVVMPGLIDAHWHALFAAPPRGDRQLETPGTVAGFLADVRINPRLRMRR
jgi:hypothetical protein